MGVGKPVPALAGADHVAAQWFAELREREVPRQEIDTRLREYLRSLEPAPNE
jgi:hypothetical protein